MYSDSMIANFPSNFAKVLTLAQHMDISAHVYTNLISHPYSYLFQTALTPRLFQSGVVSRFKKVEMFLRWVWWFGMGSGVWGLVRREDRIWFMAW